MKRSYFFIGALCYCISAFSQSTIWKNNKWECRISDKGTLEQIVFKNRQANDTVPFFHTSQNNCGPSFYAEIHNKKVTAPWIPDGYLSYRATIDNVECFLTYKS